MTNNIIGIVAIGMTNNRFGMTNNIIGIVAIGVTNNRFDMTIGIIAIWMKEAESFRLQIGGGK